jgi:HK97 family phage major capsid protein
MSIELKQLRDQRGEMIAAARAIIDKAESEKRDLTDEEQAKYDGMIADQDKLKGKIDREARQQELDREAAESALRVREESPAKRTGGEEDTREARSNKAFVRYLKTARIDGEGADDLRALQVDVDVEGGYLVPPEQFVNQIIKNVDNMTFVRRAATTFTVPMAESLGVPTLDTDVDDATWTAELLTGSEDTALRFGKRALHPHPVAKRIKVSNTLIRKSLVPIENYVQMRLAYKFGITHEKAFLTGSGSNQPLGLFTASSDGISTSRDVSTGNASTSIKFDGLIEAKYSQKQQYWNNTTWLFHRDAMKQISKLKDGEGQYIWRESVREGEPDRILGRPVEISEYVPSTFTSGKYVGLLGDFSYYWIADALSLQFQRLVELYAATNQVGFIGRLETDGMPVLEEAFARVKLG